MLRRRTKQLAFDIKISINDEMRRNEQGQSLFRVPQVSYFLFYFIEINDNEHLARVESFEEEKA